MNLFFVFDDGRVITPPLTGTILPGITRDSLITLLREEGIDVAEERYSIDQWREDAGTGRLLATFACGTAAVVRSEEHTSELQSLMRSSYAVFCLKKIITLTVNTRKLHCLYQVPKCT